jgi:ribonuclease BN (tRNA processing enzyme)
MTAHLLEAYRVDIEARTSPDGTVGEAKDAYKVKAHEVSPGVVYKDDNVTVTAFATMHVPPNFGYRFETRDRTIVISGDTSPVQATIDACRDATY